MNKSPTAYDMMCERLLAKYPELFPEGHFAFECGPGWERLIDKACQVIMNGRSTLSPEQQEGVRPSQIKEKWGGLRIYMYLGTDDVFEKLDEIEHESLSVCETCGVPGEQSRHQGWITTICNTCNKEKKL